MTYTQDNPSQTEKTKMMIVKVVNVDDNLRKTRVLYQTVTYSEKYDTIYWEISRYFHIALLSCTPFYFNIYQNQIVIGFIKALKHFVQ